VRVCFRAAGRPIGASAWASPAATPARRLHDYGRHQSFLWFRIEPDGIIVLSWRRRAYRQLMKRWAGRAVRIVCLDSQWRGHLGALRSRREFPLLLKQWGGRALRRYFFHSLFDGALLSGPKYVDGQGDSATRQTRQMTFALKMGFRPDDVCEGFAVCDWHTLAPGRHSRNVRERKRFLFVGRYAPVKGISILVEAYRLYSRHSPEPWPLIVAGDGPPQASFLWSAWNP
jgi:glycosyltransferase involved in cell wall biosynthesis